MKGKVLKIHPCQKCGISIKLKAKYCRVCSDKVRERNQRRYSTSHR